MRSVYLGDVRALDQACPERAKAHGAAKVAARAALLKLVAAHPFGHQANERLGTFAEFRRGCLFDAGQIARSLDHRHLHAKADAEIRHLAFACETGG